jgi:hypothetical protein
MRTKTFAHINRTEAAMAVVYDRPCRQTSLAGDAWTASPALVRSRI